ncbi:PilZ domain-containing protein [Quadrisphaera sp. DSM 44207]|uniref:PilZ domain-containing protein n=1 Tax=Quadrisphaera sp. DSM 44207 TaxID=1881057 RepID=UPI00088CB06E|nr:PilZ domain-containing protein [Quadrisphaera sp. DSM 44207]SDQ04588.1 PilZ domain-containing protein [Quadrisphaera sp. DSM 44207]
MVTTQSAPAPVIGSSVVLLPVRSGAGTTGTLAMWDAGPAGLVVTASVALAPSDVAAVSGQRVWARLESEDGAVSVIEAIAEADVRGTSVSLTGVLAIAHEHRRTAPRAETVRSASVRAAGTAYAALTVDLSRAGARLELPAEAIGAADRLEVEVAVSDAETVSARAEVVRVDAARGEVAIRFVDLTDEDAERIERAVFSDLSGRPGR